MKTRIISVFAFLFLLPNIQAQEEEIIDRVVAVIGDQIVMESELQSLFLQNRAQSPRVSERRLKCTTLDELMVQKLLLNQAKLDSVEVTAAEVEADINERLNSFIAQIGSVEALEEYYNKSLLEIKDDFRDLIREQLLARRMQSNVSNDIAVTPSEVQAFYNSLPKDSLPIINAKVEILQILLNPPYSEVAKLDVRERLLNLRRRILEGESFRTLAILYSEDEGSAANGGELGFFTREKMYKEFSDAAFDLQPNAVSRIVETEAGLHIIQLIAREGDQVNVRHILMRPKVTPAEKEQALSRLDSIANLIRRDSITFRGAAFYYSEDESTKTTGGLVINPMSYQMSTQFEMNQLPPATYQVVREMEVGEISRAFEEVDPRTRTPQFKIIKLESKIDPHPINLQQDYQLLQEYTIQSKQDEVFFDWLKEKQRLTYVRIVDDYKTCPFRIDWLQNK